MAPRASPLEELADRLHSGALHLLRTLRREDASLGVGPAKLSALSVLVFGGPRSICARYDSRSRQLARNFDRQIRPGKHSNGVARKSFGQDFAHPFAASVLDSFHATQKHGVHIVKNRL